MPAIFCTMLVMEVDIQFLTDFRGSRTDHRKCFLSSRESVDRETTRKIPGTVEEASRYSFIYIKRHSGRILISVKRYGVSLSFIIVGTTVPAHLKERENNIYIYMYVFIYRSFATFAPVLRVSDT